MLSRCIGILLGLLGSVCCGAAEENFQQQVSRRRSITLNAQGDPIIVLHQGSSTSNILEKNKNVLAMKAVAEATEGFQCTRMCPFHENKKAEDKRICARYGIKGDTPTPLRTSSYGSIALHAPASAPLIQLSDSEEASLHDQQSSVYATLNPVSSTNSSNSDSNAEIEVVAKRVALMRITTSEHTQLEGITPESPDSPLGQGPVLGLVTTNPVLAKKEHADWQAYGEK